MPAAAYEVEGQGELPGMPLSVDVDPETEAMVTFETEMTQAKTPEAKEAARRNLGRQRTKSALEAMRDDVTMVGIGCCATHRNQKVWFIHPEGRFRKTWDFTQSFLLIYVAVMVPLRMGFSMEAQVGDPDWFVELFVDMYFISDIVFNFRTGVYDSDGVLIYARNTIRSNYLKGWFMIDIVSCFPAGYIAQIAAAFADSPAESSSLKNMKGIRILRLLRLAKMLRLGRLKRIFARYAEELQPVMKAMKLMGMMTFAMFLAHILTCIWWAVGDSPDIMGDGTVVEGWIHTYGTWHTNAEDVWSHPACTDANDAWIGPPLTCMDGDCPENSMHCAVGGVYEPTAATAAACAALTPAGVWAAFDYTDCVQVTEIPVMQAYLVSFYWSVTTLTTIGYGDISPVTSLEKVVGIFSMAIGGFLFGMLVGTLSSHITSGNIADQAYRTQIDTAREFLRMKDVPTHTRRRIMAFLDNLYTQNTAFDERLILDQLPEHMQTELVHHMYNKITAGISFFEHLDDDTKAAVCIKMKPVMASAKEVIAAEGEVGSDMYIVVKGQVTVMRDGEFKEEVLKSGAVFGEEILFQLGAGERGDLRTETHVALSAVELRCLTRSDMLGLVERFPDLGQDLAKYVLERENSKAGDTSNHDNADFLARAARNLKKIEELAHAPNPTEFKKSFKMRRRSIPNIGGEEGSPTAYGGSPTSPTPMDLLPSPSTTTPRSPMRSDSTMMDEQALITTRLEGLESNVAKILQMLEAKTNDV